ncbi:putative myo-inositol-1(or 4)-monophosphatase 1 [Leptomonas pyrrhocoris]|uniref:Inositol-1-monophosphatase n=1 Tax=Leptomonas pyrrhocoris TaxID=157538 RepID=A0A0M9FUE4_LEPPY|nr:putative myo-inositol-1(or 4)-monophosphatase 1 [Leptomonas pyrrhocoris]XP_015654735.1 putative myo-inositol-1(or 4)-monophosphatase 1 [Leptomonas pyrrhocoris]KPA76295.1 putative myo-inositol-1(or 4)-monophosphatase 1 [Leptomonas pyrrhocoris]KPA76296.1 putative myo-inositol-1(or 4)-monophosphatase 1 [Leptomonas pyrrhocoris]|eukprot:XP_015654734.1 putative myo-inositol-1(or 4)-monophosphatase 1 [Leptomonas pyrrhocoris]
MAQTTLADEELDFAMELALRAAHAAATIINHSMDERASNALDIQTKSSSIDLVTQYDRQCEEEVLRILRSGTPTYAIVSEESHSTATLGDGPTWIVDPIDGTTSFVHGMYDCCVSIALAVKKEAVLGVVNAPRLQEVFTAIKGRGAYCNGQRLHVSSRASLHECIVFMHISYNRSEAAVKAVVGMQSELAKYPVHSIRNNGACALDMCSVAAGRADAYWEVGVQAWDMAAGAIMIREAGGVVHDIEDADTFDLMRHGMCCGCSKEITKHGIELAKKYDYRKAILNLPSQM